MFLENELYTDYFKNGFGKILKSEIDLYVFHYFLLKELNCINNDSGMCLWQRNRGKECNKICERYDQCFSCKYAGKCKRITESMLCNLDKKILSFSHKI